MGPEGPSDRPVVGIDPECAEARKLIDYGLAELVDGGVVLNDRTMGAIVARTPDPMLYVRAILRMFEATRESVDDLAADFVHALGGAVHGAVRSDACAQARRDGRTESDRAGLPRSG